MFGRLLFAVIAAAAISGAAWCQEYRPPAGLRITDDGFKDYVFAEFATPIVQPPRGCYWTGGAYRVAVYVDRKTRAAAFYALSVDLEGLRSPGRISSVDLFGGLPIEKAHEGAANVSCYNASCHNDAQASYTVPPSTLNEISSKGSVALRISTTTGEACQAMGVISAQQVEELEGWVRAGAPTHLAIFP